MAVLANPKRRLAVSLMALGLIALAISAVYRPVHPWLFSLFLLAFVTGQILNLVGWREEKKAQQSS